MAYDPLFDAAQRAVDDVLGEGAYARINRKNSGVPPELREKRHWISCTRFTVEVVTDGRGIITRAAPIVQKFRGQPLENLIAWARDFGGLRIEEL